MTVAARTAAVVGCLWLAGCASTAPRPEWLRSLEPARAELEATPFYPQRDYQCGPAALATVLADSGLNVSPDELVPEVYLPARKGSLQLELIAATRKRGRLPYVLPPQGAAPFDQVADGRPVLVLLKQGAGPWPGWHYAVVVGYDRERELVILRSGTEQRLETSLRHFLWSWDRGGRWALVAIEPGELPAKPELHRYIDAAAGLEAVGRTDAAERAYAAAAKQWPDAALPRLGLANVAQGRGDLGVAASLYREALARDPDDIAARNNLADTLLALGCRSAAAREIAQAKQLAAGGALAAPVADTAARIAAAPAVNDPAGCAP